jgi:hypothetical protein
MLTIVGISLPMAARGEESSSPIAARNVVKKGTIEAGLVSGYWQGEKVFDSTSANRSAAYVLPRIGMVLTDELGSGSLAGNVELLVEPVYARYFQPFSATAAGGSLVAKYNFLAFGRWMPFFDVGAGMLWTNLAPRITEQSTPFNFLLQAGPGVQYFATHHLALTLGGRFHHISNAGIGERNFGLNGILMYVGFSYFLPR